MSADFTPKSGGKVGKKVEKKVGKKVGKKVEKKVGKKVEKKVEKKVGKKLKGEKKLSTKFEWHLLGSVIFRYTMLLSIVILCSARLFLSPSTCRT